MSFGLISLPSEILRSARIHIQSGIRSYFLKHSKKYESNKSSPYLIRRAIKDDYPTVLKLMQEAYYPEEPTCMSLGVLKSRVLDEDALKDLTEGLSMVATCKYDNCIVGACINVSTHPWDPDCKENLACMLEDDKVKKLLLFYAYAQRLPDLWKCYGVQKIFEMSNLFIKPEHRKKGIGLRLLQESRALAADCGYQLVRCDASSAYTACLCEKMNMKLMTKIPYCSYMSKEGEAVFQPPHPHSEYKIYVDDAPQKARKV